MNRRGTGNRLYRFEISMGFPHTAQENTQCVMCQDRMLPVASAEDVGIGLALFRAAVLGRSVEDATLSFVNQEILPLSDEGLMIALREPRVLRDGIDALGIHPQTTEPLYPVVQRIICFLELLKEQNQNPHPAWSTFVRRDNRFVPIVNAIAWCPACKGKAFKFCIFARIAERMSVAPENSVWEQ